MCQVCTTCSSLGVCQGAGGGTGGGSGGSGGGSAGVGGGTGGVGNVAGLVINEIAGTATDFVELYNTSSGPILLDGLSIADLAADGGPKLNEAVSLAGRTVPAGGYVLAIEPFGDGGTRCVDHSTTAVCVDLRFGISQGDGDKIHVIDMAATVQVSQTYPPNGGAAGQAYARSPNGTGAFSAQARSPGVSNP